jgi:DNA transposition AAA+ family ATPase
MKDKIVQVKNLTRLGERCETLMASNARGPRIGVVYGDTGFGKSTGITWYGVRIARAPYVRAMELWTAGSMLKAIGRELDIEVSRELPKATEEVIAELARRNCMLMIDEADYVVDKKRLINTLRDIHDVAQTPMLLVGMADFAKKLRARLDQRQFSGRIAFEQEFQPLDMEDTHAMARELLDGVKIDEALLRKLHEDCEGSARLTVVGLQRIETLAKAKGLDRVTAALWGDRPLNFMVATERRPDRSSAKAA